MGGGSQGGCERRIEVFGKILKKKKCPERHVNPRLVFFLMYKHILKILDLNLKPGPHSPTLALNFNV